MKRSKVSLHAKRFAWCIALLCVVGCGDSTGPEAIAGRYNLQSVNGEALPMVLVEFLGTTVEITDGHVQLSSSGSCSISTTFVTTENGGSDTEVATVTCTWASTNDVAVLFTFVDGTTGTGSLSGNTLTIAPDISALSGLTSLTTLWLDDNSITDLGALSGLTSLTTNPVSTNGRNAHGYTLSQPRP